MREKYGQAERYLYINYLADGTTENDLRKCERENELELNMKSNFHIEPQFITFQR